MTALISASMSCVLGTDDDESEEDGALGMDAEAGLGVALVEGASVETVAEACSLEVDEGGEPEELAEEDVVLALVAATFCGAQIESSKPRPLGVTLETCAALAFEVATFAVDGSDDLTYVTNENDKLVCKDSVNGRS